VTSSDGKLYIFRSDSKNNSLILQQTFDIATAFENEKGFLKNLKAPFHIGQLQLVHKN